MRGVLDPTQGALLVTGSHAADRRRADSHLRRRRTWPSCSGPAGSATYVSWSLAEPQTYTGSATKSKSPSSKHGAKYSKRTSAVKPLSVRMGPASAPTKCVVSSTSNMRSCFATASVGRCGVPCATLSAATHAAERHTSIHAPSIRYDTHLSSTRRRDEPRSVARGARRRRSSARSCTTSAEPRRWTGIHCTGPDRPAGAHGAAGD